MGAIISPGFLQYAGFTKVAVRFEAVSSGQEGDVGVHRAHRPGGIEDPERSVYSFSIWRGLTPALLLTSFNART